MTTRLWLAAGLTGVILQSAALAQKGEETAKPAQPALFATELAAAREAHNAWKARDQQVEELRPDGAAADPESYREHRTRIQAASKAKQEELAAWKRYYEAAAEHWQGVLRSIESGQNDQGAKRQDILNMLVVERRERDEIRRRLTELRKALREKDLQPEEQDAVQVIRKLEEQKLDNIAKLEKALQLFDQGAGFVAKRRELARGRALSARQMVRGMEVEAPLWEALYTGDLHKSDLEMERGDADPEPPPNWRERFTSKRTTGGAQ